ncbi:MAG: glycosyltransferase [Elusimicrobiaceae bacterium]|nr:glycosyltransferase [Elusimicrobiaceae bacterium]
MARIYFYCGNDERPSGGVRKLYRQADILNKYGFDSVILHPHPGMRCMWFENFTPVEYKNLFDERKPFAEAVFDAGRFLCRPAYRAAQTRLLKQRLGWRMRNAGYSEPQFAGSDVLVLPEICGPEICRAAPGVRKVIFNQNVYYSFWGYPLDSAVSDTPYLSREIEAALMVSRQNEKYLHSIFPNLKTGVVRHSVDSGLFYPGAAKKKQIAFMPRKLREQAQHLVNALKYRGRLDGFEFVPIENRPEAEVARIIRESLIFLSFGTLEGFGLPPLEAMACGCIVIGYHGNAGAEFFDKEFSYPVNAEDMDGYIEAVESVIKQYSSDPGALSLKARKAQVFVAENYSAAQEEKSIVGFWAGLLGRPVPPALQA